MTETACYAAFDAQSPLRPHRIVRRAPRDRDVAIDILFCGVCHSDLHQVRNDWRFSKYPMVPGHEIIGRVSRVGAAVTQFTKGQLVGVGCMVDTCRTCDACRDGDEPYCAQGVTWTYNSFERDGITPTQGGYSQQVVVDEHFVVRVPDGLSPEQAAPLLCAGITTYSPLRRWGAGPGRRIGVLGLGGLGHVAVRLATAMGAEVTVLSSSERKRADAARLGASDFISTSDTQAMAKAAERLHLILDTVSSAHAFEPALGLLARNGTLVVLGAPEKGTEAPFSGSPLIDRRRTLAGSLIGGMAETQAMLDFCGQHRVAADVEVIAAKDINAAFARMLKNDVRYRFVIDAKTLS